MSAKHSLANKKKWDKVPKEERSKIMGAKALTKWDKMTEKQKKAHISKMVKARKLQAKTK